MLQLQGEPLAAWENEDAAGLGDERRRGGGKRSVPIGSPLFAPPFPRRLSKVEGKKKKKKIWTYQNMGRGKPTVGSERDSSEARHARVQKPHCLPSVGLWTSWLTSMPWLPHLKCGHNMIALTSWDAERTGKYIKSA